MAIWGLRGGSPVWGASGEQKARGQCPGPHSCRCHLGAGGGAQRTGQGWLGYHGTHRTPRPPHLPWALGTRRAAHAWNPHPPCRVLCAVWPRATTVAGPLGRVCSERGRRWQCVLCWGPFLYVKHDHTTFAGALLCERAPGSALCVFLPDSASNWDSRTGRVAITCPDTNPPSPTPQKTAAGSGNSAGNRALGLQRCQGGRARGELGGWEPPTAPDRPTCRVGSRAERAGRDWTVLAECPAGGGAANPGATGVAEGRVEGGAGAGPRVQAPWAWLRAGRGVEKVRGLLGAEIVQRTHRPSVSAELAQRPRCWQSWTETGSPGAATRQLRPEVEGTRDPRSQLCRRWGPRSGCDASKQVKLGGNPSRGGVGGNPGSVPSDAIPVATNQGGLSIRSHT